MRRTRSATAGLTALGSLAALLVLAEPALGTKCMRPDGDDVLAEGRTIAIVTRTDDGGPVASLRVVASAGPKPPSALTVPMDGRELCRAHVTPGAVAAVALHRENGEWVLRGPGPELGPAFHRAQGAPVAVKGGPVVAYAAGNFGGARVAGLDKDGRAVAWGGGHGYGERVETCPGGSTVVVVGRSAAKRFDKRVAQLTVHDAATLRVLRTVRVPAGWSGQPLAARCHDAAARKVDILVGDYNDGGRLLAVDGTQVRRRDLPVVRGGAAVSDGFVAAMGADNTSLVHIGPRGTRTIARLPKPTYTVTGQDDALAVSPDGRTVALYLWGRGPAPDSVVTIDLRTGERLGSWTPRNTYVTGLTWVGPKRLLVRDGGDRTRLPLRLLDRKARPLGTWATVPSDLVSRISALGGDALVFGNGSRLTVVPRSGTPLVTGSLRLAAAAHILGVPGGRFTEGKPAK